MRNRNLRIGIVVLAMPIGAWSQWLRYPVPGTPRTKDGRPNLMAAVPRTQDGKPDLSGVWQPEPSSIPEIIRAVHPVGQVVPAPLGSEQITKYFATILADFKPGESPLRPGVAVRTDDPALHCLPVGMLLFDTYPAPRKIVQTSGLIIMLSEVDTTYRQIFTDGRKLPEDQQPSWLGSSVGKWDGDTLVVETTGLNARSTLDLVGHTHSEKLRVTERFHRVNFGQMELQLALDDPDTFTTRVIVTFNLRLFPDTDLIESFCSENEKDLGHSALQ
jgi:hypothetical protein